MSNRTDMINRTDNGKRRRTELEKKKKRNNGKRRRTELEKRRKRNDSTHILTVQQIALSQDVV